MEAFGTVLAIAGYTVAALLGVVLLVVALPFAIEASGSTRGGSAAARLRVSWAWGLAAFQASTGSGARVRVLGVIVMRPHRSHDPDRKRDRDRKEGRRRRRTKHGRRRGARRGAADRLGALMRHRHVWIQALVRFVRALHPTIWARGRVGMDDPAETAWLFGALEPLRARAHAGAFALEAEYMGEVLDVDAGLRGRLWILQLLAVALALIVKRETRMALQALR